MYLLLVDEPSSATNKRDYYVGYAKTKFYCAYISCLIHEDVRSGNQATYKYNGPVRLFNPPGLNAAIGKRNSRMNVSLIFLHMIRIQCKIMNGPDLVCFPLNNIAETALLDLFVYLNKKRIYVSFYGRHRVYCNQEVEWLTKETSTEKC